MQVTGFRCIEQKWFEPDAAKRCQYASVLANVDDQQWVAGLSQGDIHRYGINGASIELVEPVARGNGWWTCMQRLPDRPDGAMTILGGNQGGEVAIWCPISNTVTRGSPCAAISPTEIVVVGQIQDKCIVVCGDGSLCTALYPVADPQLPQLSGSLYRIEPVSGQLFNLDARPALLVWCRRASELILVDLASGPYQERGRVKPLGTACVNAMQVILLSSNRYAVLCGGQNGWLASYTWNGWSFSEGGWTSLTWPENSHRDITALSALNQGRQLVCGDSAGLVSLWKRSGEGYEYIQAADASGGEEIAAITGWGDNYFVTASVDCDLVLWEMQ